MYLLKQYRFSGVPCQFKQGNLHPIDRYPYKTSACRIPAAPSTADDDPPAPSGDAQPESVLRVGRTHVDKSVYYGGLFFR
ncbi:hypothetical protein B0042_1872 [Bifidobacterium adolescentis]|uniref:Uncharacterized protein n=1 Tax=Bifidobacterium adolescentis L2-32 TaxID=411481 RepID=A7A6T8_BIFAD|nr:hypothetical protein BIFADO_01571 [Bifidobacterium adolescentis L2-32]OSG84976.1 hypothetical protein B0042_1872 [Bifidobacterium adolescentis]